MMNPPSATLYDLPAPAKLNLFLHVTGRRDDGYHRLQSVFALVSLADSITVDLRTDGVISRAGDLVDVVSQETDLTLRAARSLQQATGTSLGAHIHVVKRIPSGAGLGGGSSDAATVLIALNRLWRCGLSRHELMALAVRLGADVPFFVFGQSAFVQGIGDEIEALPVSECSYLLFVPPVEIATAAVFGDADLTRDSKVVTMTDFSGCKRFVASGRSLGFGRNDLEDVVLKRYPAVQKLKSYLADAGLATRMTGSGSCLFAEEDSPETAQLAISKLIVTMEPETQSSHEMDGILKSVHICDGLRKHPLHDWMSAGE